MENSSFKYRTKNDYLKYDKRSDVHTSIRRDLYKEFKIECLKLEEPSSKCFDVILKMLLENKQLLEEFRNEVKNY